MRQFLFAANVLALLVMATVVIATAGFGGIPLLAGAVPPQPSTAATNSGSKIAVFNMAKVMREYEKAKYHVNKMNEEKKNLSVNLIALRAKYEKNKQMIESEQNANLKAKLQDEEVDLKREIEDKDRKINKHLNEEATALISLIYDEIKAVVDKLAETNGHDIVFAYPDATTPEELKNPYVKELKLKPPAAQPFFVAKRVDVTDAIIKELNTHYPAPAAPEGTQFPPMPNPTK